MRAKFCPRQAMIDMAWSTCQACPFLKLLTESFRANSHVWHFYNRIYYVCNGFSSYQCTFTMVFCSPKFSFCYGFSAHQAPFGMVFSLVKCTKINLNPILLPDCCLAWNLIWLCTQQSWASTHREAFHTQGITTWIWYWHKPRKGFNRDAWWFAIPKFWLTINLFLPTTTYTKLVELTRVNFVQTLPIFFKYSTHRE